MSSTINLLKQGILNKIEEYKHSPYGRVAIKAKHNGTKYQLLLLTEECAENKKIVSLLENG